MDQLITIKGMLSENRLTQSEMIRNASLIKEEFILEKYQSVVKDMCFDSNLATYNYQQLSNLGMLYLFVHDAKTIKTTSNGSLRVTPRQEKTIREYIAILLEFLARMDVPDVRMLNRRTAAQLQRIWLNEKANINTLGKKTNVIKSFLKYLYKVGYIEQEIHSEWLSVTIKKEDSQDRKFTDLEIQRVEQFYKKDIRHEVLFRLLAETGMRIAELATAAWSSLEKDPDGYWLRIIGKGDKPREVYITSETFDLLVKYRMKHNLEITLNPSNTGPFFPNMRGKYYSSGGLSQVVTRALDQCGVRNDRRNPSAHWFRHLFAVLAHRLGIPIEKIQKSLGHESIKTTERYLFHLQRREDNAGRLMAQLRKSYT